MFRCYFPATRDAPGPLDPEDLVHRVGHGRRCFDGDMAANANLDIVPTGEKATGAQPSEVYVRDLDVLHA